MRDVERRRPPLRDTRPPAVARPSLSSIDRALTERRVALPRPPRPRPAVARPTPEPLDRRAPAARREAVRDAPVPPDGPLRRRRRPGRARRLRLARAHPGRGAPARPRERSRRRFFHMRGEVRPRLLPTTAASPVGPRQGAFERRRVREKALQSRREKRNSPRGIHSRLLRACAERRRLTYGVHV